MTEIKNNTKSELLSINKLQKKSNNDGRINTFPKEDVQHWLSPGGFICVINKCIYHNVDHNFHWLELGNIVKFK